MNRSCIILFFVLLISTIPACKSVEKSKNGDKPKPIPGKLTKSEKIKNTALFIDANNEKIHGNYKKAAKLFSRCIEENPKNAAAMYELAKILRFLMQFDAALTYANRAKQLYPENIWYQQLLADVYKDLNRYGEAAKIYKNLVEKHPDNIDFYGKWAKFYILQAKYDDAIKIYNIIEEKFGITEKTSFQKQKLYLHKNKKNRAEEEIRKLIEVFPYETQYYSLLAEMYMTNNKHERALKVFKNIIEIDPNNANVHISLAAYYREIGQKDKSYEEMRLGFRNPNLNIDTKIKILLSYYSITGIYDELKVQAYELAEILIKVHPEEAKAHSIYADFLFRDDKFMKARDEFRLVLSYDSSKYIIWEQLLIIESELNDFKAMAKESKRAMTLFPEQPLPYLYSGEALYRLKRAGEAVGDLKMGINFVVENNAILVMFYERLGDAYFVIGENELSDDAFEKAVKYWEKAASLGKGSEFLDKKIRNKKLFE